MKIENGGDELFYFMSFHSRGPAFRLCIQNQLCVGQRL